MKRELTADDMTRLRRAIDRVPRGAGFVPLPVEDATILLQCYDLKIQKRKRDDK